MKAKDLDHCDECHRPFTEVRRAHNRRICVRCWAAKDRSNKTYRSGLFPVRDRQKEAKEIAKYYGRALLERRRRMARYAACVAVHQPIAFEPRA
jgi:recombinational DNA repair protein (RecF pathway)